MNLYQHAKNEAVSSICSGEMADLKMLQSDQLRAFWPISQKQDFPQIYDLCRNTANNINLEKPIDPIPRKHLDRKQDQRTDRPYFIGSFRLPPGVPQVQMK